MLHANGRVWCIEGATKANGFFNCSLAYAELYMVFARVFSQLDMELVDTTAKDVAVERVHLTGYPRLTGGRTNGEAEVKVKVTHKREA